ncbi:MAG: DUF362 domain-containing protein [Gemmatimonadaceae bacterium]
MTERVPQWADPRVAVAELPVASYEAAGESDGHVAAAIERMATVLGWGSGGNPFAAVIPPGARVVVKPNWVLHENHGPWGIEPLLTHASLIRAVVRAVLNGEPSTVVVGDAPIQGCDFERLLTVTGIGEWGDSLSATDSRFGGVRDFRRTRCVFHHGVRQALENQLPLEHFVLFDLGHQSLLEAITDRTGTFRVTQYDPAQMARTHAPGTHQYLVARDILEADVVINLPKLKTHKKAGLTCALKNLIGINGNKEYLPHHRVGGSEAGGDCYPGRSSVKRILEHTYDELNSSRSPVPRRALLLASRMLHRLARMQGDRLGVEGSWSGNDTIWRTCLDLNRILLYGRTGGSLAAVPQRLVLNVVDAVIAGQGDGPLAPQPLSMGLLFAGSNSAAVDHVAAHLLGYDPRLIPIVREAFVQMSWPLSETLPEGVQLLGDLGAGPADKILSVPDTAVRLYPAGWLDAVASDRPKIATTAGTDERVDA